MREPSRRAFHQLAQGHAGGGSAGPRHSVRPLFSPSVPQLASSMMPLPVWDRKSRWVAVIQQQARRWAWPRLLLFSALEFLWLRGSEPGVHGWTLRIQSLYSYVLSWKGIFSFHYILREVCDRNKELLLTPLLRIMPRSLGTLLMAKGSHHSTCPVLQ